MHRSARVSCGMSTAETRNDAPSSTAPAAVTQERSGLADRKNTSIASDVSLSSVSANHASQDVHRSASLSSLPRRWYRAIISIADGGEPARTSSSVTADSRLWNAAYIVGR